MYNYIQTAKGGKDCEPVMIWNEANTCENILKIQKIRNDTREPFTRVTQKDLQCNLRQEKKWKN